MLAQARRVVWFIVTMVVLSCGGVSVSHPSEGESGGSAGEAESGGRVGGGTGASGAKGGNGGSAPDESGGTAGETGGRGGASGGASGADAGVSGAGGSDDVTIDPDGACSPPCGVKLEEALGDSDGFPPGALGATLFYDTETETLELRSGTATPAATELVVMLFTWESNQYGYSEWIRGADWAFVGFEPDTHNPDGYSRPEGVEFTAWVERATGLRVRVTFFYANQSLFVREAVREA